MYTSHVKCWISLTTKCFCRSSEIVGRRYLLLPNNLLYRNCFLIEQDCHRAYICVVNKMCVGWDLWQCYGVKFGYERTVRYPPPSKYIFLWIRAGVWYCDLLRKFPNWLKLTRKYPSGRHYKSCLKYLNAKERRYNASSPISFSIEYTGPSFMLMKGKEMMPSDNSSRQEQLRRDCLFTKKKTLFSFTSFLNHSWERTQDAILLTNRP